MRRRQITDPHKMVNYYVKNITFGMDTPSIVYHYCSVETMVNIITTSTIRLSNIKKSNDPEEVVFVKRHLVEIIEDALSIYQSKMRGTEFCLEPTAANNLVNKTFNSFSQMFHAGCFSRNGNKLSQWTRYADEGKGIAIGFNTSNFINLCSLENDFIFADVEYDIRGIDAKLKKEIDIFFSEHWGQNNVENQSKFINLLNSIVLTFAYYAPFYKNSTWYEEEEYRLVYAPRRLFYNMNLFHLKEWLTNINQVEYTKRQAGFIRHPIQYKVTNSKEISSYINLDFSEIKDGLIREIVLGPSSNLKHDDLDLLWMLTSNGYTMSPISRNGCLHIVELEKNYKNR